jgi:membrane-bound inhibitor of C-type lysozyme
MLLLLTVAGCAAAPIDRVPVENAAPALLVPPSTRVLGQAALYVSATGEKLEVVHDAVAGIVIVKQPDGGLVLLPAEISGVEGRYRDSHMTLWEKDGGVLLWIDGKLVFNGRGAD